MMKMQIFNEIKFYLYIHIRPINVIERLRDFFTSRSSNQIINNFFSPTFRNIFNQGFGYFAIYMKMS